MQLQNGPRQLANKFGYESLSITELVAVLLRHGTKSQPVQTLSEKVSPQLKRALQQQLSTSQFCEVIKSQFPEVKEVHFSVLASIYELLRHKDTYFTSHFFTTPQSIAQYFQFLRQTRQERFYGVYLDSGLQVKKIELIAKGTTDCVAVEPRDVLYYAVKYRTRNYMLVHNHPSGRCEPSNEDIAVTQRMKVASELLQLKFLDHIIIATQDYYSFAQHNCVI